MIGIEVTKPESLTIQGHILRGISWRAKASVSGQPWGVLPRASQLPPPQGIGYFASLKLYSWAFWTDSVPFSTPCSYHHALALIRFYGHCCWLSPALLSPEQAANLSTHSMKSTLLAAAGQLNMNLENRAKQAHHKKSVQLYSRDDVWPSLFLQRDILVDVSTGWRPLTSQARGAI